MIQAQVMRSVSGYKMKARYGQLGTLGVTQAPCGLLRGIEVERKEGRERLECSVAIPEITAGECFVGRIPCSWKMEMKMTMTMGQEMKQRNSIVRCSAAWGRIGQDQPADG